MDEAHRGKGARQKLFDVLINKGTVLGATEVELNVYSFNEAAVVFYRKNGFENICTTMGRNLR